LPSAPLDILKRTEARLDLIGIWIYTSEVWGDEQANRYLLELNVKISGLQDRSKARRRPVVYRDLRRLPFKSHRIYYLLDKDAVEIVRVFHSSMDVELHLT
jgi:toxin ParE1/3/4